MARPKKIKDGVRVSVVLSKEQLEWTKRMAIRMSTEQGKQIGVSEAIRMAIEKCFPLPNTQMEFF